VKTFIFVTLAFWFIGCSPTDLTLQGEQSANAAKSEKESGPESGAEMASGCDGVIVERGGQKFLALPDGSAATLAAMQVNVDGSGRTYHRDGFAGGAILHLCNAGEVHLPDGTRYHGSESNATCTGKFMDDVSAIAAAGWDDPNVGAVRWYGIVGTGSATIAGRKVDSVRPAMQPNGSGFFVSPTTLKDTRFAVTDQRRYVDALEVPHGVVRRTSGIDLGTTGVAWRVRNCPGGNTCRPTPFIVADIGPRIGEGSLRLTRLVNGLDPNTPITRANRFAGAISEPDVLWVFFNDTRMEPPFDSAHVERSAADAFARWGGRSRLEACLRAGVPDARS
jgi:hypothetical protein